MKEQLASLLLILNKSHIVNKILQIFYLKVSALVVSRILKIEPQATIYTKGSFARGDFTPALSDIDFVAIVENKTKDGAILNVFKKMNRIFPFIKDVDVFTQNEFNHLIKYGKNKYRSVAKWKLEAGIDVRGEVYRYYPLKFFIEQVHELFFHTEWILFNFNAYKTKKTFYRKEVIKRTVRKIIATIDWIVNNQSFEYNVEDVSSDDSRVDKIYRDIIFNNSLLELSRYLAEVEVLLKLDKSLPREFSWFEKNEIVDYLDDCNELVKVGDFSFIRGQVHDDTLKEKITLSAELSNLFFKLGCFHFDHLVNFSTNTQNRLCGSMSTLFAYSLILEGKTSFLMQKNLSDIEKLSKFVDSKIDLTAEQPVNLLEKTVIITVNWGHDERRYIALKSAAKRMQSQSLQLDWFHFDVCYEKDYQLEDFPENINRIVINGNKLNSKLWLKECLYNIAAHYCFHAKNYIFTDADVYSEDEQWLEKLVNQLNSDEYDFVHGFRKVTDTVNTDYTNYSWTKKYLDDETTFTAPGLVWGIPRKTYIILEYLPDIFPDGSNDGALIQELTNVKMGGITKFDWYSSRIRTFKQEFSISYCDVDVIHINHGASRDYINRVALLDLVKVPLEQMYHKDAVGLYEWFENDDYKAALDLSKSYFELDSLSFINLVDTLIKKDVIKIPKEMIFWSDYPHKNYIDIKNGIAFLYSTGKDRYKIVTSSMNKNMQLKFRWDMDTMMDNEHLFAKFKVKKETETSFDIGVNYNWWRLAGSNNTYDPKYFEQRKEQYLGVCASSWEDHARTFVDIETHDSLPGEIFEIEKETEERINFFHIWNTIGEVNLDYKDIKISKNSFVIPINEIAVRAFGWVKVDIKFKDIEKIPLKVTVLNGNRGIPITTTRIFDDSTCDYIRVMFYKNAFMNNLKVNVKLDIRKEIQFSNVSAVIHVRKKL